MKIASFDIFDTVLIRRCGKPENIFYLLSKRIYPDNRALQNAFFLWRKEAEKCAIVRSGKKNLTLEDIYRMEFDIQSFPQWTVEKLMALEIETEMNALVAVYETKRLIAEKRRDGYRICFISDMYLPGTALKEKLIVEGCAGQGDDVFVSCEMNASKREGDLYDVVKSRLGKAERWEHYGDNLRSDVRQARKKGIKAHLIHTGYTKAEEYVLDDFRYDPSYFDHAILGGLQRAARLTSEIKGADADNAADFIASLYVPYVKFLLGEARKNGLKRLYFLSRDGYILREIADELKDSYRDIEIRYLFVSRYSLFLPTLYTLSREELYENKGVSSFWQHRTAVKDLLHYLRVSPTELGEEFTRRVSFKQIRTPRQEDIFFDALQMPEVKALILGKAAEERRLLTDYLRQEGVLTAEPCATVDVGWVGTSRLMMNRLLENEGFPAQDGFYCGCSSHSLPPRFGKVCSFYGDNLHTTQTVTLLEQYYSASPYASTRGYYRENGEVKIKFKGDQGVQSSEIIEANRAMARSVARLFTGYADVISEDALRAWGGRYLSTFVDMKCRIDYSTFSRLGLFDDVTSADVLVKRISPFRLLSYLYKGKIKHVVFPRQSIFYTYRLKVCAPSRCFREQRRRFFAWLKSL